MKQVLKEGGLGGHMSHIYENGELTFGELKDALAAAAMGQLEGTEKTDGQNIKLSFNINTKKAVGARNTGQVKSGGLNVEEMSSFFKDHPNPNLKDTFSDAVKIFERAAASLSEEKQIDLFGQDSNIWYNAEVMDDRTRNVVNYDGRNLMIHRTGHVFYNRETQKFEEPEDLERKSTAFMSFLEGIQDKISTKEHGILVNPIQKLKKLSDKTELKRAFAKIQHLMSMHKLSDKNNIYDYLLAEVEQSIETDLPEDVKKKVIFSNLGITKINKKDLKKDLTPEQKAEVDKIYNEFKFHTKRATMPLEVIITDFAAEMLKTLESIFILDNKAESERLSKEVQQAIKSIESSGSESDLNFLKMQLEKLKGADTISSAVEGFAFTYKGKIYKFTGKFAPVNQILGLFKYGRGGSKPVKDDSDVVINEEAQRYNTALLGGGFKPPHKGHIELLKQLSQKAEKVYVLTSDASSKGRTFETGELAGQKIDGAVCNLFLEKMLDQIPELSNVEIMITNAPVREIFEYVGEKAQQDEKILLGVGGKEGDADRFKNINKYIPQEKNLTVDIEVLSPVQFDDGTVSATKMREAISNKDLQGLSLFIPDQIANKEDFAREMIEAFFSNTELDEFLSHITNSVLEEVEEYQKKIQQKHPEMKNRLLNSAKPNKNSGPYRLKVSSKRSKSAPPGFGGA